MKHQAVYNTHPEVRGIDGSDPANLICMDANGGIVTDIDYNKVATEEAKLQAEYDAQEYARNREAEYPSIAELTIALYDTDDKAAIETKRAAVKAKYPNPS